MRRWILFAAAAVVLLVLAPVEKTDVGELLPVELLYVYTDGSHICVETDTGDLGKGTDLETALADLKAAASGSIFLETADYLIVTEETKGLLPGLTAVLRPAAEVCVGVGADAQTADFLKAHKPGVTLNDVRKGKRDLPVLTGEGERYHLESEGKS